MSARSKSPVKKSEQNRTESAVKSLSRNHRPQTSSVVSSAYAAIHAGFLHDFPAYTAWSPSSSSILMSWLYLALRSERQGAPVLIWPVHNATAKSAMVVSSVSPERWEHITPQSLVLQSLTASMDSERLPIWFTLSRRALQALVSMAF